MPRKHPQWRSQPRRLEALLLFWIVGLALLLVSTSALARVKVIANGPRSGTAAGLLREALERAGVQQGTLVVQVHRGHPAWTVSVVFQRADGPALVRQTLQAPHGYLSEGSAQQLGRRVAAALGGGGAGATAERPKPARPKPERVQRPPAPIASEKTRQRPAAPATPPPSAAPTPKPAQPSRPKPAKPSPPAAAPAESADDLGFQVSGEPAKRSGPRPTKDTATKDSTSKDDLGFESEGGADAQPAQPESQPGDSSAAGEINEIKKSDQASSAPADRVVLRVDAGFGLANRRFLLDAISSAVDYSTGFYSQISVHGELYPLQLLTSSPIARLGIRLGFETSAGLNTDLKVGDAPAESYGTTLRRIWGGLTYWLPRFKSRYAPTFDLRFGVAYSTFEIAQNPIVQDLSYTTVAAGANIGFPIRRWLSLAVSGEYRGVLRGYSPSFDAFRLKAAAVQGFALDGAVVGRIFGGLGYRAAFAFERLTGDLPAKADGAPAGAALHVRDHYYCGDVALTYEL